MKRVCTSLREHATNIINKKELKVDQDATACYIYVI